MKSISVIVALIVLVSARSAITSAKSSVQVRSKSESFAAARAAEKTEVEWINGPQFRSTGQSQTSLATMEMVDSESGTGDIIQTKQAEKAMFMLKSAITQIKGDIMRKSSDLRSEADWVAAVKGVMIQFELKVNKTKAAITDKKNQIEKTLEEEATVRKSAVANQTGNETRRSEKRYVTPDNCSPWCRTQEIQFQHQQETSTADCRSNQSRDQNTQWGNAAGQYSAVRERGRRV